MTDFGTVARENLKSLAAVPASLANLVVPDSQSSESDFVRSGEAGAIEDQCIGGGDGNRLLSIVGVGRLVACSESTLQVLVFFVLVNTFVGLFNLLPLLPLGRWPRRYRDL